MFEKTSREEALVWLSTLPGVDVDKVTKAEITPDGVYVTTKIWWDDHAE